MELERLCRSIYCFFYEHSSLVENVKHLSTGYIIHILIWFILVFQTVLFQGGYDSKIEAIFIDLFDINQCWYSKEEFDDDKNIIYWPPHLDNVRLYKWGRRDQKQELSQQRKRTERHIHQNNRAIPEIIPLNKKYDDNFSLRGAPISDDELNVDYSMGTPPS